MQAHGRPTHGAVQWDAVFTQLQHVALANFVLIGGARQMALAFPKDPGAANIR